MSQETDQACHAALARDVAGQRSINERVASVAESLRRVKAPQPLQCSGTVTIGMFFDGTKNNMHDDYEVVKEDVKKQKHSNVVRLYHVYPDKIFQGADAFYAYYAPGVGTPFKDVGDFGGSLGSAFAAMGEARILWGLTCVFNAISQYLDEKDLLNFEVVKHLSQGHLQFGGDLKSYWLPRLAGKIAQHKSRPRIDEVVIDVFGFSRGAAQARAWVNQLYALCEAPAASGGAWRFAGLPLRVRFMGLFDTVAAVGSAGLLAGSRLFDFEGHMDWARRSLQIPPQVGHCLHFVAGHEVRACFPSDSVRVDHAYPSNCREVLYPGAHSDVGGGYRPDAQGKQDKLARVPGFAMYEAAREKGVPFLGQHQLPRGSEKFWNALVPQRNVIQYFNAYQSIAATAGLPLQEGHRAHMALYFRYRMHAARRYGERPFMDTLRAQALTVDLEARQRKLAEQAHLLQTQKDLLETARVLALLGRFDTRRGSRGLSLPVALTVAQQERQLMLAHPIGHGTSSSADVPPWQSLQRALAGWRAQLLREPAAELLTDPPDLDLLAVADALCGPAVPERAQQFFDFFVHDSMASFMGDDMNEHRYNQRGLFKHRRQYFGNAADAHERRRVDEENARRLAALRSAAASASVNGAKA